MNCFLFSFLWSQPHISITAMFSNTQRITTVYIPNVERTHTAEFIADVFRKSELADVFAAKITIRKNHSKSKRNSLQTQEAIIEIDSWHDTETAYHFIQNLRKKQKESKLIYNSEEEDGYWEVKVYQSSPPPPPCTPSPKNRSPKNRYPKSSSRPASPLTRDDSFIMDEYWKEISLLVNTLAFDEQNWLFDEDIFAQYEREIFRLVK